MTGMEMVMGKKMGSASKRLECECPVAGIAVRLFDAEAVLSADCAVMQRYLCCSNSSICMQRYGSLEQIPGCLLHLTS